MGGARQRMGMYRTTSIAVIVAWIAGCPSADELVPEQAAPQSTEKGAPAGSGETLTRIAAIANGFERNAALYGYIADAGVGRIEALLAEAVALPDSRHRDDIARVLYIRYASLDPAAATDHALRARAAPDVLTAVFRAWAHRDLDSAVARAADLPTGARSDAARAVLQLDLPSAEKESIAERLGSRLDVLEIGKREDPDPTEPYEEALARIEAMADGRARHDQFESLSSAWVAVDPAGALSAVFGWQADGTLRNAFLASLMEKWAKNAPRAAVDWLLAHDPAEIDRLTFSAFQALAKVDLAEAESLLATLPAGPARSRGHAGVFDAILERGDLERAVAVFAELDRRSRQMVTGDLGRQLARASPERAFEWLVGLDEEARRRHFPWSLTEIYSQDQSLTKRLIQDVGDPELRIQAARVVADWEMSEPEVGLAWAESLGSDEQVAPVVADMFRAWFERDAQRATTAVMDYPRGSARDQALRTLVGVRLWAFDTVAAERFFDAIDSPEARRSAAEGLYRYYTETDPNERKAAVFSELATEAD